jgi:hypothetical protein
MQKLERQLHGEMLHPILHTKVLLEIFLMVAPLSQPVGLLKHIM